MVIKMVRVKDVAHSFSKKAIVRGRVNVINLAVNLEGGNEGKEEIALKTSL